MASKNNPALRDNQRLYVYCPTCTNDKNKVEMAIIKRIPGGIFYICSKCGGSHRVTKRSYLDFQHEWKNKK